MVLFSTLWSCSVLLGPHWFYSVQFGLNRSYSIRFGLTWSTLVLFGPIWSYPVLFGPLWSYSFQFGPTRSTLFLFDPIWSYSVHFGSIQSYLVHFCLLCPLSSYSVQLVLFGLFWSIGCIQFIFVLLGKRQIWVENTYFKSKFIKKIYRSQTHNIQNLKYNIYYCYASIELHSCSIWSISIQLNLSESLSKHEGYEYTNVTLGYLLIYFKIITFKLIA